jgi:hypothetical protein
MVTRQPLKRFAPVRVSFAQSFYHNRGTFGMAEEWRLNLPP